MAGVSPPADLVLLVPGWGTPATRLEPMSAVLSRAGAIVRVWSYTPEGVLEELVERFATTARAMRDLHGPDDRLHLVGHSLGGLVVAATALRALQGDITTVTTVNTPWRGTWASHTGSGPLSRSLRRGSISLSGLRHELTADLDRPTGPRWLLLAAAGDLTAPATTSLAGPPTSERLDRRVVAAAGHSVSLTSDRLIDAVLAHLRIDRSPGQASDGSSG